MGRAVITTDVPGCRETVVAERNGLLVPSHDSNGLAQAMIRLAGDADLRTRMGHESRRLAEERFDVHRINENLVDLMLPGQSLSRAA